MDINLTTIKSALISSLLSAVGAMAGYVVGLGDVFKVEWQALVNIGILTILVGVVSLVKSVGTNSRGEFAGVVKIK